MKATKAGTVIGMAMTGFEGEGVGVVIAFVKTGYGNGAGLADILPGLTEDGAATEVQNNRGKEALQYFVAHKEALAVATNLSEITTDRMMAGLEVITPKVITQELAVDQITASLTSDINVVIGPDGQLTIGEVGKAPTTTIDAFGNATFAGMVTAKTIRADSIEGLEIFTDQISSLSEKYAGLEAVASPSVPDTVTDQIVANQLAIAMQKLSVGTLEAKLDADFLGQLTVAGGLVIGGDTQFGGKTLFNKLASFFGDALFKGKVVFEKAPTFSSNTAGFAVITEGQKSVDVLFDEAYAKQPIVSVSLTNDESPLLEGADKDLKRDIATLEADFNTAYFDGDIKYIVTRKSEKGFTIVLNKRASRELQFSWVALAVSGAKTSYSKEEAAASGASANRASDEAVRSEKPDVTEVEIAPVIPPVDDQPESVSPSISEAASVDDQETLTIEAPIEEVAPITDSLGQLTGSLGQ